MNNAKEILNQIGKKAMYMIGGKQLVALENGLQFRIGKNHKGINIVQVVLNSLDLYDMKFYKGSKLIAEENGLYGDMLNETIESNTGMYTTL